MSRIEAKDEEDDKLEELDKDEFEGAHVLNLIKLSDEEGEDRVEEITSEYVAKQQDEDPMLLKLKRVLRGEIEVDTRLCGAAEMKYYSRLKRLKIDEKGCLVTMWYNKWLQKEEMLICVPQALQERLIEETHLPIHINRDKLINRLRKTWFFPFLATQATLYVGSCVQCARVNATRNPKPHASMKSYYPRQVGDILSLDCGSLISDVKRTATFQTFLVAVDNFSGYIMLFPLRSQTAEEICFHIINGIIPVFGVFRYLTTDRGSEFNNKLVRQVCDVLGIHHGKTPALLPRRNGRGECAVGITKRAMKKC